jgi:hypothetical protein
MRRFPMLVLTESGFLEIVKEPQFEDIYTVQSTDLASVRVFRKHTRSKTALNDYSRTYRFYAYGYLQDIAKALDMQIDAKDIETLDKNISPAPVGYTVLGFWHDKEGDIQAEVLAEELKDFRYGTDFHFDEFRAWPLFHMTDELIEQKNAGL